MATGICTLLLTYGFFLFTSAFWAGAKEDGWPLVLTVFGLSAITSLVVSIGVILLYRFNQDAPANEQG